MHYVTLPLLCRYRHEGLLLLRHPRRQCWNIRHYRRTVPRRIPRRRALRCHPF